MRQTFEPRSPARRSLARRRAGRAGRAAVTLAGLILSGTLLAIACAPPAEDVESTDATVTAAGSLVAMNEVAEWYVRLVLALGEHDPGYVDAYYGPDEWREEVAAAPPALADVTARAVELIERLDAWPEPTEELPRLRQHFLTRQLRALVARVDMLSGQKLSFDQESQALYDAVAPRQDAAEFEAVIARLDERLPGAGPVLERWEAWQEDFVIPTDKLDAVFRAAIEACRERTAAHLELPAGESFEVEYVTDEPWSAYNWYQGGFESLIQVNTSLPITIDRAIDLACHEGYPGHHVYNALLEKELARDRGWVEFTVYPLYSPQSLIAEGTANFGIEMAFPGDQRARFESEVLFPIAGIPPERAAEYYDLYDLRQGLSFAGNEAARRYLDGEIDAAGAQDWLERYALMPPERAAQRVAFIDRYRSYVINYNLGQELVREYVESRGGTPDDPERRWELFTGLLTSPRVASGLAAAAVEDGAGE